MLFCYFWNFDFSNLRITFSKKLFGTEISIFQVKFYSTITFHNWYFLTLSQFYTRFNKGGLCKILVKRNSKFDDACLRNKRKIYLNFSEVKNFFSIFLSAVKICIRTFLFYEKNICE